MTQCFRDLNYTLDLLAGLRLPLLLGALRLWGVLGARTWRLFWMGSAFGLSWEGPIFVLSAEHTGVPVIRWVTALPAHYLVFMIAHTLWDGGIFLTGMALVRAAHFQLFKLSELDVLLLWGQASALLVELSSTLAEGWVYVSGYSWKPTLFPSKGCDMTLVPQAI